MCDISYITHHISHIMSGVAYMLSLSEFEVPSSLKGEALRVLKNAILENQFQSEKIYKIDEIAKDLGISKTPVREALMDLANKGFLILLPRKGLKLITFDKKKVRDFYEFRIALEVSVIRTIATIITEDSIVQLETINSEAINYQDCIAKFLEKDREFHLTLANLTRNEYLMSALENVRDLIDWTGSKALIRQKRVLEVYSEHDKVIQFLKKGSCKNEAIRAMEEHILLTMKNVLKQMEN